MIKLQCHENGKTFISSGVQKFSRTLFQSSDPAAANHAWERRARWYLALGLVGVPLGASDFVLHGHVVDEGVSLWWWEEGLRLLPEVELDGAVLHQHVGEEGAARQRVLGRAERHAERHAVLGVAHLHLVAAIKVLHGQNGAKINLIFFSSPPAGKTRRKLKVARTYDVAADDVVLPKSLAKICKLGVFRFLSCASVAKGERLFTCTPNTRKESE